MASLRTGSVQVLLQVRDPRKHGYFFVWYSSTWLARENTILLDIIILPKHPKPATETVRLTLYSVSSKQFVDAIRVCRGFSASVTVRDRECPDVSGHSPFGRRQPGGEVAFPAVTTALTLLGRSEEGWESNG
jgi:hypothetical protein